MKKLTALLLTLMLLCTTAYAETADVVEAGASVDINEIVNFDLSLDAVPEGYTYTSNKVDGVLIYTLESDNNDVTAYMGSVAFSEEFDGYTLKIDELSPEQLAQMEEMAGADFQNPTFSFTKTTHGTDLIVVDENGVETDYIDVFTIYEGYFINISMLNPNGELTQADIDRAVQFLSDMWIVKE